MNKIIRLSPLLLSISIILACNAIVGPSNSAPALKLTIATENDTTTYQQPGETIRFNYAVTNIGAAALSGPVVISDGNKVVECPSIQTVGNLDDRLDPNEVIVCTSSYTITAEDARTDSIVSIARAKVGNATSSTASIKLENRAMIPVSGVTSTPRPALTAPVNTETAESVSSGINFIEFGPGQTSYSDSGALDPNETIPFMFEALSGQKLHIQVNAAVDSVGVEIYASSGTQLKPLDAAPTWEAIIPEEGEYYLDLVNLVDSSQSYVLEVELSDETLAATATPESSATVEATKAIFDAEEAALESLPKANFEYIVPLTLKLNETFQVELHISRSASGSQLSTAMVTARALATSTADNGTLVAPEGPAVLLGGGQVEVTPFMLAELTPENEGAFEIRALHENPVQVVDQTRTATWLWLITAKKEGRQKLIFVISQQARSNDEAHWHTLETERREVQVNVTFGQRLGALDWKWIVGILVTALLIPAFWRYMDGRRKAAAPKEEAPPPARPKRTSKKKPKE